MRWSGDHIIFIMGIPVLVRQHLFVNIAPVFSEGFSGIVQCLTGPRSTGQRKCNRDGTLVMLLEVDQEIDVVLTKSQSQ